MILFKNSDSFPLTAPSDLSSLPRSLSDGADTNRIFQQTTNRVNFSVDKNILIDYISDLVAGYPAQCLLETIVAETILEN